MLNLLCHAAALKNGLCGGANVHFSQKKINAPKQAIEFIARHLDGLAGLVCHDGGERLKLGHDAFAKAGNAGLALSQGHLGPGELSHTGLHGFGCDRSGIVSRQLGDQCFCCGVVNS